MEVTRLCIKKFLDPRSSVVEHTEEHVITFSVAVCTVHLPQQVTKFQLIQVAQ